MKKILTSFLILGLTHSAFAQYSSANQDTEQNSEAYNAQENGYVNDPSDGDIIRGEEEPQEQEYLGGENLPEFDSTRNFSDEPIEPIDIEAEESW